jgi:predicted ferric reductase
MNSKKPILILSYIIAIIFPSFIYSIKAVGNGSEALFILSGILGITSYVLLCFQFLLVSRTKMLDKHFGLDKIYRFHMKIAVLAIALAFAHKMTKGIYFSESFKTELGDIAFNCFLIISILSILMMVNRLFFKIDFVDTVRSFLNKNIKIKYQHKVLIHNLTLVGLIVLLVHILLAYSVTSNILLEAVLVFYFAIPFALYFNHKIIKVHLNKNSKYTVSEVISNSSNIVTLKFKPQHGNIFNYLPGQFLYLKISSPELHNDEHPFTISSSPSEPDHVSVTVKQLGDFTNNLTTVKVGDTAYLSGAFGSFSYLNKPSDKKICFIAGGIGITPFLSMLRYMNSIDKNKEVLLLWGARDTSEIIYKNELDEYALTFKNFKYVPVISNDNSFIGEKGFITTTVISKYLDNVLEYDFYICGPPIMLDSQLKNLNTLGVSKGNIHFERFAI